ncbi:MAG: response regulator transcription factor [Clostridia bacterium]|nr:response regulator transcription factor [Clostridia bacterium]
MSEKIRVLLADDHPLMTEGLRLTMSGWEEFDVVGVAADGAEALELCRALKPDIVILDMQMPKLSGPEVICRIKSETPEMCFVALTTFDDQETVRQAMKAGCNGFLLKVIEPDKLRNSLLSIMGGLNVYDKGVMAQLKQGQAQRTEIVFSQRELEILRLVCQGMTNTEIADRLGLRPGTVKNMVSMLLSKTGCISRAQLARYVVDRRLVE